MEQISLPQAESAIRKIYGGEVFPKRYHRINALINDSEEETPEVALAAIEQEYRSLELLPTLNPAAPPPPRPASPRTHNPRPTSSSYSNLGKMNIAAIVVVNPALITHRMDPLRRKYILFNLTTCLKN